MITQQAQIKLNLPLSLKEYLESKAGKFGIPLAAYIRHLILKDIEDMDYPTYAASDKTVIEYRKALKNRDKAIEVKDLDKFFDNL